MINIGKWTSLDQVFSTDGCLAGGGGVCDDQYFHGVFPPFISEQNLLWNYYQSLLPSNYGELVGQDFASLLAVITSRP